MQHYLFIFLVWGAVVANAQNLLPTSRNIQRTYDKGTRSINGRPGKNYWQNTADYDLDIHFYPGSRLVSGKVNISYVNNSPDTLKLIMFKLYPNLYKKNAPKQDRIDEADQSEGVIFDQLAINDEPGDILKLNIDNTNMWTQIKPLAHGEKIKFNFTYHYTLNKRSQIRTGEIDPGADFVAYFFPRIAVYDDIDGWNRIPYNGNLEFYNDFCHFKAAVTVPSNQLVWASGNLLNAKEVLSEKVLNRLEAAEKNDEVATLVDSTEFATATNHTHASNTWVFEADHVTDFVFACSDHYMWHSTSLVVDSATGRRTRVDAAFNPKHKDFFNVIHDARKTVEVMSYTFPAWPFPYPHETVFDGLSQMEYPMMVNDNPVKDHAESIELTDHEIFHTMFPFYMGINETKYAWMDEGWATIGEWIVSPMIDSLLAPDDYGMKPYESQAGNENDLPIMTVSTQLISGYFINSYPKPAMGYLYIKDLLGDALFTKALHNYIRQWQGKHPMPNDFFYSMNEGSMQNLNWFWKRWFFDGGYPDLAITSVKKTDNKYNVLVTAKGTKPVPVDLTFFHADNTTEKVHRNVGVWETGKNNVLLTLASQKPVRRIILGDPHTPDSNPKDNEYEFRRETSH